MDLEGGTRRNYSKVTKWACFKILKVSIFTSLVDSIFDSNNV